MLGSKRSSIMTYLLPDYHHEGPGNITRDQELEKNVSTKGWGESCKMVCSGHNLDIFTDEQYGCLHKIKLAKSQHR